MTDQEYQQKKCECWEEYKQQNLDGEVQWQPVSRYDIFSTAFDRGYALGKQEKEAELHEVNFANIEPKLEKNNGICIDGKFYVATKPEKSSCLECNILMDDGSCLCRDYCFYLGRCNIFRYSPELTEKINKI